MGPNMGSRRDASQGSGSAALLAFVVPDDGSERRKSEGEPPAAPVAGTGLLSPFDAMAE